jgi:drug/metabolite transporter (DMT)-like permease
MLTLFLLLGSVSCDVAGQVCFKLGVGHHPEMRPGGRFGGVLGLLASRWVVAGVLIYVIEFALWFAALSRTPLSFAFPFMALSYCGVVLASRLVLHERVPPRRWLATIAVAVGVAMVCWP